MRDKLEEAKRLIEQVLSSMDEKPEADEFSELRDLLGSQQWPQAVHSVQIADEDSETDKDERAEGIVDMMLPTMEGKKFLDFGCGEGHVTKYVAGIADFSVGYDRTKNPKSRFAWETQEEKMLLTVDFEKVKSNGPYDTILIYDVLDHTEDSTPSELLKLAKSVLADEGRIYLRTHPWCGRHGGHLYRKMNKAFVHLIFTKDELALMEVELENVIRITAPVDTYSSWIESAGLKKSMEPVSERQEVEPFFGNNPIIRKRILKLFGKDEWSGACPEWQMSQSFWDYVLEK